MASPEPFVLDQPPPKTYAFPIPGPGAPRLDDATWTPRFFERLQYHGGFDLAAQEAGVSHMTPRRRMADDPDFAERVEHVRGPLHRQFLKATMVDQFVGGREVPGIFLLKGEEPEKYNDRVVHSSITTNITVLVGDIDEQRAYRDWLLPHALASASLPELVRAPESP